MTTVSDICAALEIEIVGKSDRPKPMQTRAAGTMQDVCDQHGAGHLSYVLKTIVESRNNRRALSPAIISAVSDIMAAYPAWCQDAERWFGAFDRISLEGLEMLARLTPDAPWRATVKALLMERLLPIFGQKQGEMRV